jgi:hypothetical protein
MKLKELINQYVAFRKSLRADLTLFWRYMGVDIDIREIQAERVATFLAGTGPGNRYWRPKYDTQRGSYRYPTSWGFVHHVPLPTTVPKMPERFTQLQCRRTAGAHQSCLSRTNRFRDFSRSLCEPFCCCFMATGYG